MKRLVLVVALLIVLAGASATVSRADEPGPIDKTFWCYDGLGHRWRCWCVEWLRYPICRRWYW